MMGAEKGSGQGGNTAVSEDQGCGSSGSDPGEHPVMFK